MSEDAGPEDDDTLAAEAALGVLEAEDRAKADRRRLADPAFARAVDAWSWRLAGIAVDEAGERAAPSALWPRIERGLGGAADATVARLKRSLGVWRGAATALGAVAAALVAVLVFQKPPAPPPVAAPPPEGAVQAASLAAPTGGQVAFVAVLDAGRGELVLTPATIKGASGHSPELWVIPTGGAPISLGVGQFGKPVRLKVSDLVGKDVGRTLAVTLEPQGGSPSGKPTGPIIASGALAQL